MEVLNQIGFEALTVSTAAVALTGVSGSRPTKVRIHVLTADVRFRADGTDPTATVGTLARAGSTIDQLEHDWRQWIENVKFIRTGGADATLEVEYFG